MRVSTEFDLHVHSRYSSDSLSTPEGILKRAARLGLRGLSVNDHDSLRGGLEATRLAKKTKLDLIVVPSEEVKTTAGDVLGLLLNEEIHTRDAFEAIDLIHAQGGLAVLPHPFRAHNPLTLEQIARRVDVIETANSHTYFNGNEQARALARRLRKPECGGSDAHFLCELGLARTIFTREIDDVEELLKALKKGSARARASSLASMRIASLSARLACMLVARFKRIF